MFLSRQHLDVVREILGCQLLPGDGLGLEERKAVVKGNRLLLRAPILTHGSRYFPFAVHVVLRHPDVLHLDVGRKLISRVCRCQMQPLAEVLFHQSRWCRHAVEESTLVRLGHWYGHTLVAHLCVELVLTIVGTLLIFLLIHRHLVDDPTIGKNVGSLVFLHRHLGSQLGRIILLHHVLHLRLPFLISCDVGSIHLHGVELLAVELSHIEPAGGIHLGLEGMSMGDFVAIDRNHLRLAWLMFLLGGSRFLHGLSFLFLFRCFRSRFLRCGFLHTLLLLQTIHDGHTKTSPDEFG